MGFSFKKFFQGINLVPKTTSTSSSMGDLEVLSTDGKLRYNDGLTNTAISTVSGVETLANKTIDTAAPNIIKINGNLLAAPAGTATLTFPNSTDTLVARNTTDILTNKTLTGNTAASLISGTGSFVFNTSGVVTTPNTTDTLVGKATTDILTNKTLSGNTSTGFINGAGSVVFNTTGAITLPNGTDTLVGRNTTDILTNKTLSGNIATNLVSGAGSFVFNTLGIITTPNTTDTLVGKATTDILTNKTLTGNTAVNLVSGAGSFVFNTTGTITTPNGTDTLVGKATTDVLTNKTLSGNAATGFINGAGSVVFNTTGAITLPNATDTLVGKATTDTLTNKTIGDSLTLTQIATPATPAAGLTKVYSKADNNLYTLNPAGLETLVGSGAGGGTKNYLSTVNGINGNGDFELGSTAGFSLFNTTLTGVIPTGTITTGAAGLSIGITSTPPNVLGGKYSGVISGASQFTAGQGFISDPFTIDQEDQAKVLQFKINYKANNTFNFSGTSSNTFAIYIYDVTAGQWIQPSGVYGMTQLGGVGQVSGNFQSSFSSTQYRIAILCINTYVLSSTLYVDDFFVGPQVSATGVIPKAPTVTTLTSGSGTYTVPVGVNFLKVRMVGGGGGGSGATTGGGTSGGVGSNTTFSTFLIANGGAAGLANNNAGGGGGGASISLPAIGTALTGGFGNGGIFTGSGSGSGYGGSGGNSVFGGGGSNSGYNGAGSSGATNTGGGGGGGGYQQGNANAYGGSGGGAGGYVDAVISTPLAASYSFSIGSGGTAGAAFPPFGGAGGAGANGLIEITEYYIGTNVQMSNDTDTRVVAANLSGSTTSIPANVFTPLIFSGIASDTHSAYNVSTGIYTAPVSGFYDLNAYAVTNAVTVANGNRIILYYKVNNNAQVEIARTTFTSASATNFAVGGAANSILLNAGDQIVIAQLFDVASTLAIANFDISRRSGPSVIANTESVNASYYLSANSTAGRVPFDTIIFDSHNAATLGASFQYKTPVSGTYLATFMGTAVAAAAGNNFALYKNGSNYSGLVNLTTGTAFGTGTILLKMLAGDTVYVFNLGSINLAGGTPASNGSSFSIARVGN